MHLHMSQYNLLLFQYRLSRRQHTSRTSPQGVGDIRKEYLHLHPTKKYIYSAFINVEYIDGLI